MHLTPPEKMAGKSDRCRPAVTRPGISLSSYFSTAPASIQALISASSSAVNCPGWPPCDCTSNSLLAAESFGTTTGPSAAPFIVSAYVLKFSPFVASAVPWHMPHFVASTGPTCSQVTVALPPPAGGATPTVGAAVGVGGSGVGVCGTYTATVGTCGGTVSRAVCSPLTKPYTAKSSPTPI